MRPLLPSPDGLTRVFEAPDLPPSPVVTSVLATDPGARDALMAVLAASPLRVPTFVDIHKLDLGAALDAASEELWVWPETHSPQE